MKILYRQEFISAGFHPFILFLPVACRAMPVMATVILIMHMPALTVIAMKMVIT